MADQVRSAGSDSGDSILYDVLKNCASLQSYESLPVEEHSTSEICAPFIYDYNKMISTNCSISKNVSSSSFSSDESFGDFLLEENGRISLAYENLDSIPRKLAEKYAVHAKCLDLSYNNFRNLSFLTFFDDLHTLILDRNINLDVNSLPYLPNLRILWINNCEISNITDWIHRIKQQCPALEQLSIMGNPGLKNLFNFNAFIDLAESQSPALDYKDYILQVLPNLKYLDGTDRKTLNPKFEPMHDTRRSKTLTSSSSLGNGSIKHYTHNASLQEHQPTEYNRSSVAKIKEFFQLKNKKNRTRARPLTDNN